MEPSKSDGSLSFLQTIRRITMPTQQALCREKVFKSLPADRRTIMERTGLFSHEVPTILRWLQRRCLADNSATRGIWEPVVIPKGVEVCWEHGLLHLGTCQGCKGRRLLSRDNEGITKQIP